MKKRLILLLVTIAVGFLTVSCALMREPFPASDGGVTIAPAATPAPSVQPDTPSDYNG